MVGSWGPGLGFGVWGMAVGGWGLVSGVWGLNFRFWGLKVYGLGVGVGFDLALHRLGKVDARHCIFDHVQFCLVKGSGIRVSGFRDKHLGCEV